MVGKVTGGKVAEVQKFSGKEVEVTGIARENGDMEVASVREKKAPAKGRARTKERSPAQK